MEKREKVAIYVLSLGLWLFAMLLIIAVGGSACPNLFAEHNSDPTQFYCFIPILAYVFGLILSPLFAFVLYFPVKKFIWLKLGTHALRSTVMAMVLSCPIVLILLPLWLMIPVYLVGGWLYYSNQKKMAAPSKEEKT